MKAVALLPSVAKRDVGKCILCQKKKAEKLRTSQDGRDNVQKFVAKLGDNFLDGLTNSEKDEIQHHGSCYSTYKLKADRVTEPHIASQFESKEDTNATPESSERSMCTSTRTSTIPETSSRGDSLKYHQLCIICNNKSHKGERKKCRISEDHRAKQFIHAYNFIKDEVYTRCVLYKTPGDIYAADLYAHKDCTRKYVKTYADAIRKIIQNLEDIEDDEANETGIQHEIDNLCAGFDLSSKGYVLSECRDQVNAALANTGT